MISALRVKLHNIHFFLSNGSEMTCNTEAIRQNLYIYIYIYIYILILRFIILFFSFFKDDILLWGVGAGITLLFVCMKKKSGSERKGK